MHGSPFFRDELRVVFDDVITIRVAAMVSKA